MKVFFIKISLTFAIVSVSVYYLLYYFPNGYIDPFYKRFSSPAAPSLIIGTSRAALGLQPEIIEKELRNSNYCFPIYNYAFTIHHSPFGQAYLKSIKLKLEHTKNKNGLFIITVDPWSISDFTNKDSLADEKDFINKMYFVNQNPNFQYFFKFYKPLYNLLLPPESKISFLHDDGWLEVNLDTNTLKTEENIKQKIIEYRDKMQNYKVIPKRIAALEELIEYLKKEGDVFLVRLPVSEEMEALENEYMPLFDKTIEDIKERHKVTYFNYITLSNSYKTIDGNHLHKASGARVSLRLANDIIQTKKLNK